MSFHFKSFALAALAASALAGCQPTQGGLSANKNVTIVNNTGQTIWRFYGSPTSVNIWEEDILGSDILPAGSSVNINFADGRSDCMYDMRAVFRDGTAVEKYQINVCTVSAVTFY